MNDWKEPWKIALGPQVIFLGCLFLLLVLYLVVVSLCATTLLAPSVALYSTR